MHGVMLTGELYSNVRDRLIDAQVYRIIEPDGFALWAFQLTVFIFVVLAVTGDFRSSCWWGKKPSGRGRVRGIKG